MPDNSKLPLFEPDAREDIDIGTEGNDAEAFEPREGRNNSDETLALTGFDAPVEAADIGDAGNGASESGADLTGLENDEEDVEDTLLSNPKRAEDIIPVDLAQEPSTP